MRWNVQIWRQPTSAWVEWISSTLLYIYTVSRSAPKSGIVFHLFDLICVEAWLLYSSDCMKTGVTKEMPLLNFKSELAQCLSVAPIRRKVGRRPSTDVERLMPLASQYLLLVLYNEQA